MRILITGVTGFVGGHLADHLLNEEKHTIVGLGRHETWPDGLQHLAGSILLHSCELADEAKVASILEQVQPDWIFHLAGYANTGKSFQEPARCWADNVDASRALFRVVAKIKHPCRVLFVSTGLVYGDQDQEGPIRETAELRPASPYAASKAAAELVCYQLSCDPGLDIIRVRLFNQIGPRQSKDYAVANFARQIADIEAGRQEPVIQTGDLSASRDITDVRDVVAAFRLLIERGQKGQVYNAGRGQTYMMADVLEALVAQARSRVQIHSQADPARRNDTRKIWADTHRLQQATGWLPRYDLPKTLADILTDWRSRMIRI